MPVLPEKLTVENLNRFYKEIQEIPQTDKFNNHKINPKYLFLNDYFDKIKKLRDIFIEFDEDNSSILSLLKIRENGYYGDKGNVFYQQYPY